MPDVIKKPWESDASAQIPEQPAPKAKSNKWVKGMKSPNPTGRPKGIVDKRQKLNKILSDRVEEVLDVVIEAALERDVGAASLILSRVVPTLRPQDERVEFDLDTSAPMSAQVEQVLLALSQGNISPDAAKQVIDSIGVLDAIRSAEELKERLAALEAR